MSKFTQTSVGRCAFRLAIVSVPLGFCVYYFGDNVSDLWRYYAVQLEQRGEFAAAQRLQETIEKQTVRLPRVDQIEILALGPPQAMPTGNAFIIQPARDYAGCAPIIASVSVSGESAEEVANLWRTRSFGGGGAMCHEPAYALRFYYRGRLLFETSLCWSCGNCFVLDDQDEYRWLGFFDADQTLLKQLGRYLPLEDNHDLPTSDSPLNEGQP